MHKIMSDLHQDHVNLTKLLTLLAQQVEKLAAGDEVDLLLMSDIADYIRRYSDQIHHPKEDEIYRVFRACSNEAGELVEALLLEHQQLPDVTLDFQKALESVINDTAILTRQELHDQIVAFISTQQAHLDAEEGGLFPLINTTLQAADWAVVEQGMQEHAADPLFGVHIMDRYRNLHQLMKERQRA
ncbi:MAG: hemerythrin domain-containing protein [Candidatus Thiothrix moscowensis]|nr:hemerythrin domain-containing protein [Candidatus Thiothrix moscowensis]